MGGLAYSGKIMQPQPFSPLIAEIRDRVHAATGIYFDCCLLNLYRDGECACAYHSDPDMVRTHPFNCDADFRTAIFDIEREQFGRRRQR